ncbi:MAG TPA: DUF4129 domain-containing protein, partial [Streptosporangiaceae bacterium]|nr:DUF4129 domain-containing protein [Streptosporangiaceae bacterium]
MANGEAGVAESAHARPVAATGLRARASSLTIRYSRPIIVALLLLILIAGTGAAGPAVGGRGPWRQDALALGIGLEVALGVLQIALVVRARRSPDAGHLAIVLRSWVRNLAALVMIAIVAVAIANIAGTRNGGKLLKIVTGKPTKQKVPKIPKGSALSAADVSYALYALILLIALIACVVLVTRLRRRAPGGYAGEPPADETDELRRAVESGRTALRAVDDARAAIIACYLAMERSLARAGTTRTVAETPDELLGRAAAAGLIHGPAAARLTGLFYEARFSS